MLVKVGRFFISDVTPAKSTSLGDRLSASRECGTGGGGWCQPQSDSTWLWLVSTIKPWLGTGSATSLP